MMNMMNKITDHNENKSENNVCLLVAQACHELNNTRILVLRLLSDRRNDGKVYDYAYASETLQHEMIRISAIYASSAHFAPCHHLKTERIDKPKTKTTSAKLANVNEVAQLSQQCKLKQDQAAASDKLISLKCMYLLQPTGQDLAAYERLKEPAYSNGYHSSFGCIKQKCFKDETSDDYQISLRSQLIFTTQQTFNQMRFINIKNLYSYKNLGNHSEFQNTLVNQSELQNISRNYTALVVSVALKYCLLLKAINASFC